MWSSKARTDTKSAIEAGLAVRVRSSFALSASPTTAVADFIRIASPPLFVQDLAFPMLAVIGRARGYHARYPEYASSGTI